MRGWRWTRWAVLGVAAVGMVGVRMWPRSNAGHFAAALGLFLAVASSVVALWLKRWGLVRSLQATLAVVGAVFMLRLVLVVAGLFVVKQHGGALAAFVVAFFVPYLFLQWVEIVDVLAENRRDRGER